MSAPVSAIGGLPVPEALRPAAAAAPASADFRSLFQGAVERVEQFQKDAAGSVGRFLSGESEELHSTALAAQRAELAFDLFLQTRNKVVSAYQEIMRMQI
jgi:flagellar hook-basal body complex protein FliE